MEQTTIIPPTTYLPMVVEASEQTNNIGETIIDAEIITEDIRSPFIEANSQPTTRSELMNDCIIPVYAKDNEVLISHNQFIEATYQAARDFYQGETIAEPEIRVSHIIRGRVPEAINKPASQLLPEDKTMYWERMCFCIEIPSLWQDINGNRLNLSICGVKSYGMENLNGRLTAQKFTFAVGFQNKACCNLCLWTDGYKQVGADCGSSRAFVDVDGNSLSHKKFRIECSLDFGDKLSYQDSFKYFSLDNCVAYNFTDVDYSYNLDSTNGELEDDDEEMYYAEYQDRDAFEVVDVIYHNSTITCDSDCMEDFEFFQDAYYHSEDDLTNCPECDSRMLNSEYYRDELFYSELTEEHYCCQKCKDAAELQFKKDNWHFCDFDQKFYEQDDILTTYNAWNEDLGMYETKTVNIDMVEVYINCEILFRIGDELYDEINEQTELPLDVEVEEEALIEA